MARQVRVQFAGAIYHAMARGDRREPIVKDDDDREAFARLLAELVERTGFEVFAWVLMTNHYHLAFKTPEPNLVEGMKWFQNTWTKRFNARHGLWGHLYGGRYKAVLVEDGEHLGTLIDYIHLNPFRAGLVELKSGLESYAWSSLPDYVKPPRRRRDWVQVERGLVHKEFEGDTAAQRRRYLRHLEGVARERGGVPELPEGTGGERTLQSTLRRGWYFGGERFRERLVKRLEKLKGAEASGHRRRSGYNGPQARDHGEAEAMRLIKSGLAAAGLRRGDLKGLKKSDWRKRTIGRLVRRRTVMPVTWIAEALAMGHPNQAATLTRTEPARDWGPDWKEARDLMLLIENNE